MLASLVVVALVTSIGRYRVCIELCGGEYRRYGASARARVARGFAALPAPMARSMNIGCQLLAGANARYVLLGWHQVHRFIFDRHERFIGSMSAKLMAYVVVAVCSARGGAGLRAAYSALLVAAQLVMTEPCCFLARDKASFFYSLAR